MIRLKNIIGVLVLGSMLLTQLVSPVAVYADGDTTPPPTDTTEVTTTPDPAETTVLALETSTPVPPDALEMTSTPVPTEPTADPVETAIPTLPAEIGESTGSPSDPVPTTTTEESTLLETLQELPGDTDIVVLDDNGDPLSLVTQEAADVIANSDPMWCPAGDTTITAACITADTVTELITQLGSKNEDGTVYFTSTYSANDVKFDGANTDLDQLADNTLTLQGGWDGATSGTITYTDPRNSTFSVPISITNWIGAVTINDITVNSALGNGLTVTTSGNISAENINVTGSRYVSDSNPGYGAYLDNTSSSGNATVTLNGTNAFNGNYNTGLYVQSRGDISANDISANNSIIGSGAYLDNCAQDDNDWYCPGGAGNISLTGINSFNGNQLNGIQILSYGYITANTVTAQSNGSHGAYLTNRSFLDNTSIGVTLTGTNRFTENGCDGLHVYSSGNVTLNNIIASNNNCDGTFIDNRSLTGGVFLTGSNFFNDNKIAGLEAISNGNIVLNDMTANNNIYVGLGLYGVNNVTLNTANFNNNNLGGWYGGNGAGLVYSNGDIVAKNVTANNNVTNGLALYSNGGDITLSNIIAEGNGQNGVLFFTFNDANINGTSLKNNTLLGVDASAVCGTLELNSFSDVVTYNWLISGEHSFTNPWSSETVTITCEPKIFVNGILVYGGAPPLDSQFDYDFELSCDTARDYPRTLPNGDKVKIVCPVWGNVHIARLDNTTLPADLPAGYTYASAFEVEIKQKGQPIDVINTDGHIEASFVASSLQTNAYSVLYWDSRAKTWIPLKNHMQDESGNSLVFDLNPGATNDTRKFHGANPVTDDNVKRIEFSTNFPGIFVLVQQ